MRSTRGGPAKGLLDALAGVAGVVLLVATVVALQVTSPAPADASGTCVEPASNYFDGFAHNASQFPQYDYEGSSGYIVVRNGSKCLGHDWQGNFSNAWVMLAAWQTNGWSQVGFEHTAGHPLRWFSQELGGGQLHTTYSPFAVDSEVGVRHTFRVLWSYDCACLRTWIDVTNWSASPFNPFASSAGWGSRPFSPQFSGETGYLQDDIPGGAQSRTVFSALGAQRFSDDQLEPMPCTMTLSRIDSPRWGRAASRCDAFDIWTQTP